MFMHGSCKSVIDGEHYIIVMLVVSLVLRCEAVAHIRIQRVLVFVVATMTHTNPHWSSITYASDVLIQLYCNCTLRRHPNLRVI